MAAQSTNFAIFTPGAKVGWLHTCTSAAYDYALSIPAIFYLPVFYGWNTSYGRGIKSNVK
jgi:hypothetical protein